MYDVRRGLSAALMFDGCLLQLHICRNLELYHDMTSCSGGEIDTSKGINRQVNGDPLDVGTRKNLVCQECDFD